MWLMKVNGFQVSVREGFSPGSIVTISCGLVGIVYTGPRVNILDTGGRPDGLLFMKNQLLKHPVIITVRQFLLVLE